MNGSAREPLANPAPPEASSLLFLTQRIPYPPIKGEKIRPLRILQHFAPRYRVHLGCLIDDPSDWAHTDTIRQYCQDAYFGKLDRRMAKLLCARGLLTGEALSVTFFRDRGLAAWTRQVMDTVRPERVFVCSGNMAPYVLDHPYLAHTTSIADLADVDSEKWRAYAAKDRGAMRLVHAREARRVSALERRIAAAFTWSTFVTDQEAALFRDRVPDQAARVRAVTSGVDAAYFDPQAMQGVGPPAFADRPSFVFTGTMDYPPNVDAVTWFAVNILPLIRQRVPDAAFLIVGASPAPAVVRLGQTIEGVRVTGRVADVRPYLAHAVAAVAPMRIARGIQNKVLEAMSMARPVVVTSDALEGIGAAPEREIVLADGKVAFAEACASLIPDTTRCARLGAAARLRVLADYAWDVRLGGFDALLGPQQNAPHARVAA